MKADLGRWLRRRWMSSRGNEISGSREMPVMRRIGLGRGSVGVLVVRSR